MSEEKRDKPAKISFRGTVEERKSLRKYTFDNEITMDSLLRSGANIARKAHERGQLADLEEGLDLALDLLALYRGDADVRDGLKGRLGVLAEGSTKSHRRGGRQRAAG